MCWWKRNKAEQQAVTFVQQERAQAQIKASNKSKNVWEQKQHFKLEINPSFSLQLNNQNSYAYGEREREEKGQSLYAKGALGGVWPAG